MAQPAKSAKLQLLNGNPNKRNKEELERRAAAEEKMKMQADDIRAPNWLDNESLKVFEFLKKELLEVELITNGDTYALAMYAYWYAKHVDLQQQDEEAKKYMDEGEFGSVLIKQLDTCSKNLRMFGNDLGLSPSARTKLAIKIAEEESKSEWD